MFHQTDIKRITKNDLFAILFLQQNVLVLLGIRILKQNFHEQLNYLISLSIFNLTISH